MGEFVYGYFHDENAYFWELNGIDFIREFFVIDHEKWRLSRALRELSNREKDSKVKEKLLEDALRIAELSLELKINNWAAHKWIGIILG